MDNQLYYINRPDRPEKTQEGPYEKNHIISQYQAGEYPTNTLVWCEGMSEGKNIQLWIQEHTAPEQPESMPPIPSLPQDSSIPTTSATDSQSITSPFTDSKKYYVMDEHEHQLGPYSLDELEDALLKKNGFSGHELCWEQGISEKFPLNSILDVSSGSKIMSTQSKIAAFFFCLASYLSIRYFIASYTSGETIGWSTSSILSVLIAIPLLFIRLYKAWKVLQNLSSTKKIPSPIKTILFLFIPVFNFYWGFIAFCKISTCGNILLKRSRYISLWPFLTHCILCLLFVAVVLSSFKDLSAVVASALCITDIFVLYHLDKLIFRFYRNKLLY